MDAKTALDTLLARLTERSEYAHFESADPDVDAVAVPIFVIEDVIADLMKEI